MTCFIQTVYFGQMKKNATLNICQHLDITLKFAEPQKMYMTNFWVPFPWKCRQ